MWARKPQIAHLTAAAGFCCCALTTSTRLWGAALLAVRAAKGLTVV
jgi:hypothetical protein